MQKEDKVKAQKRPPRIVGFPRDLYFTVSAFRTAGGINKHGLSHGSRAKGNVQLLNALFVDLDVGRTGSGIEGRPASEVHGMIDDLVNDGGLPPYNVVTYSGLGLQLFWILKTPLEATVRNLARFTALERALVASLKNYAADRAVIDAPRVLRLPGTSHSVTKQPAVAWR